MASSYIDGPAIGKHLGKSAKTGRAVMRSSGLPQFVIGAKRYVRRDDFEAWIESQRIDRPNLPPANSLKLTLDRISETVLAKRKAGA